MTKEYENYKISQLSNGMMMYTIANAKSGSLPEALKGMFTTVKGAMNAIDGHLALKKGKKDGKAESTKGA